MNLELLEKIKMITENVIVQKAIEFKRNAVTQIEKEISDLYVELNDDDLSFLQKSFKIKKATRRIRQIETNLVFVSHELFEDQL